MKPDVRVRDFIWKVGLPVLEVALLAAAIFLFVPPYKSDWSSCYAGSRLIFGMVILFASLSRAIGAVRGRGWVVSAAEVAMIASAYLLHWHVSASNDPACVVQ